MPNASISTRVSVSTVIKVVSKVRRPTDILYLRGFLGLRFVGDMCTSGTLVRAFGRDIHVIVHHVTKLGHLHPQCSPGDTDRLRAVLCLFTYKFRIMITKEVDFESP